GRQPSEASANHDRIGIVTHAEPERRQAGMLTVERSIRLALIMVLIGAAGCGPQGARSVSAPAPSASCPITAGSWQSGADQAPPGTPAVVKLGPGMEVTRNVVTLA